MNPGSVDPLPGLSLENLLKQNGLYEQWVELQKQKQNGKS
jgi:hypothetical protein